MRICPPWRGEVLPRVLVVLVALVVLVVLVVFVAVPAAMVSAQPEEPQAEVPEEPQAEVPEEPQAEVPEEPQAEVPEEAQLELPIDIEADRLIGSRGPEGDEILLEGNVRLRRGSTVVHSSQGRWVTATRTIYLTGGVTAEDGALHLTADQADYHETTDFLLLSGNVHVIDGDLDAHAEFGSYDGRSRKGELWGNVRTVENGRRLRCRRLSYFRDTRRIEARGDVRASDSSGTTILLAQALDFDRQTEITHAYGSPRLTQDEDGKRVVLTADTLILDNRRDIAWANGHARIDRDTLKAEAARMVFWNREDRGLLVGQPKVWDREIEATGDTIEVFTRDGDIDRASVRGNAVIKFVGRSGIDEGERNELRAPEIVAFFGGDEVDSMYAVGGALNLYEAAPRPGILPERNEARGDRVKIYFADQTIDRAVVTGSPEGEYHFELAEADSNLRAEELVVYDGVRVEFLVQERKIQIDGDAHVIYQGMDLKAGRIRFDSEDQTLVAHDNPVLKDHDEEELKGRTMTYDLQTRTGTVYQATTAYDKGFYTGQAIHEANDNTLLVRGAQYTTCSNAKPHYHIGSNSMKIQIHDKIIARPLVFYLKDIPILALPFYIIPVNPNRHSGIIFPQIQFGFSSNTGRFIRNLGYFWAPNDYMDFTASGDYFQRENALVMRGEARYRVQGKVDGRIETRFTRSRGLFGSNQEEVRAFHNQVLGPRTRLTAQANFTSSRAFTRDLITGQPLANRFNRFLISNMSLNHRRAWGSFNFTLNHRKDLDANPISSPLPTLTQDLPQFSLRVQQRPIGRKATKDRDGFLPALSTVYYNYDLRGVNRRTELTTLAGDSVSNFRAVRGRINISDSRRIFAGISISPRFSSTQVFYERDAQGNKFRSAAVYNLGIGASATYYGTFHPHIGPLTGLRHVLFPQLSYTFQPNFSSLNFTDENGIQRTRFPSTAGIGISSFRQSFLSYGLQHRIQLKFRKGDGTVQVPNFLTLSSNGAYDFLWREKQLATPWRPVTSRLRIQPPAYFTVDGAARHVFDHKPYLRSLSFSVGLRLSGSSTPPSPVAALPLEGNEGLTPERQAAVGPWTASLSYSYAGGRDGLGNWKISQTANSVLSINPTSKWRLQYYNTINLNDGEITAQEYSVVRDLHCWQARFVRRFTSNGESEFYFRLSITEQPELYIEQGTRGLGSFAGGF